MTSVRNLAHGLRGRPGARAGVGSPPSRLRAVGALALCALACAPRSLPSPRPSLIGPVADGGAPASPARWRFHPPSLPAFHASAAVGEQTLLVGEHGERWLLGTRAEAAAARAPETRVGVLPGGAGWVFFGASGTTYEAEEPLGPFLRAASPPTLLHGVSATSRAILARRAGGHLTRSADLGVSWEAVGPPDLLVADAALEPGGRGLAIAIPERLFFPADHGKSWSPLDQPTVGALSVEVRQARLIVEGALGSYALTDAPSPALTPVTRAATPPLHRYRIKPARGPSANAIAAGTAVVTGGRYLELVAETGRRPGLALLAGPLEGPLRRRSIEAGQSCRSARIAAHGSHVELACSGQDAAETTLDQVVGPGLLSFWRSDDGGRSWRHESLAARGDLDRLRMAVGPEGELLLGGVCSSQDPVTRCHPLGILYRQSGAPPEDAKRPARTRRESAARAAANAPREHLATAVAPSLRRAPLALAFGPTGIAYALGFRTKGGDLAVFVSQDGGRSFSARDLVERSASGQGASEDGGSSWRDDDEDDDDTPAVESFAVGADGAVALVLRRWGSLPYWVLDAEGRTIATSTSPGESDALGACGRRGLAQSTGDGKTWETLDGGVSWQPAGSWPTRACRIASESGDGECSAVIACAPAGCVLGDELTRLGWRSDPEAQDLEIPALPALTTARAAPPARTPISCTLGTDAWRVLDHATTLPDASDAAIGDVAWFVPVEDRQRGALGVWNATTGAKARVEYVPLLGALPPTGEYAQKLSPQVEGAAALRFRLPTPQDPRLSAIEVAWQNLFERRVVRASLGQPVPYRPGDFQAGRGRAKRASPALLSIASGGIYLRPHGSAGDHQPTYFLDGRRVEEIPPLAWPAEPRIRGRTEIAHLDQHVPFLLTGDGSILVRAVREGNSWALAAAAIGPAAHDALGLSVEARVAYHGANAAIAVQIRDQETGHVQAWLYPIATQGAVGLPPIPLPGQGSLADPPPACTAEERASTPRSVASAVPGTGHAVIVADAREPLRLLTTGDAVLHGTPERACVAAFHAVPGGPMRTELDVVSAILPLSDLEHAWLFRPVAAGTEGSGVEYRSMSCRFDPGAEIPDDRAPSPAATPAP